MLLYIIEYRIDTILFACIAIGASAALSYRIRRSANIARTDRRIWAGFFLFLCLGGIGAEITDSRERHRLQTMLEGLAPTYASELSELGHATLPSDVSPDSPLYLKLLQTQIRWLSLNRAVNDIYTLRRTNENKLILIVDSETDYDGDGVIQGERESRTPIGEALEESASAIEEVFLGKTKFMSTPVTDRWGTWVTAYAPMFDANGNVEAVLAVDYEAANWVSSIAWARLSALGLVGILVAVLVGMNAVVSVLRFELAERTKKEELLCRHQAELNEFANRLQATNAVLDEARKTAEAAAAAKGSFLANMSHEMRTPLTAIIGYTDLMLQGFDDGDEASRKEFLGTIRRSGQNLLAVVNDVLDLAKFESGKWTIEKQATSPRTIVKEVHESLKFAAIDKGLKLHVQIDELPDTIISDPLRLRQILLNLTSNAIKFTPSGEIKILASSERNDSHPPRIRFEISDTGIGIPADKLDAIFAPFVQADSSVTRKFGGTGLGLTISRQIAQSLGGDVTVISEVGKGSTFTVTITSLENSIEPPPQSARPESDSTLQTVA